MTPSNNHLSLLVKTLKTQILNNVVKIAEINIVYVKRDNRPIPCLSYKYHFSCLILSRCLILLATDAIYEAIRGFFVNIFYLQDFFEIIVRITDSIVLFLIAIQEVV